MSKEVKKIKNLKVGTFHPTFEGSKTGHPGFIYWNDEENNLYLAITTGTSEYNNDHFDLLTVPTEQGIDNSFVNKRPFLGKRKDFGATELTDMHFSLKDYDVLLRITKRNPRNGSKINSNDRRKAKRAKFELKKLLRRSN